jgi:hypothetical protein
MNDKGFKYQFIPVRLRDLDAEPGDLLVASLFSEDRPPVGLAGLVDWRMDGLLSRIRMTTDNPDLDNPHYRGLALGPFKAAAGEKLLFPPGRTLPFFMVLIVGLGSRAAYASQSYRHIVKSILETAASMKISRLALQLPGWSVAGLPGRRACDVFLTDYFAMKRTGAKVPASVCFVEDLEFQAEMDEKVQEILKARPRR